MDIAAGGDVELDYTCSGTGHPSGTNTAVVSFGDDESVSDTVDVVFAPRASVRDSVVEVYDDKTDPDAPPVLLGEADAEDGPTDFTYQIVKSGIAGDCRTYTNTAWAVLEASADPDDTATATLCVEKPLTFKVSALGTYGVTYPWTIDKDVDQTRVEVDAETGEATFNYVVTVAAGTAQRAGWTLGGQMKIRNPNTYGAGAITLTGATVSTNLLGGAVCTADLPDSPVVPVDGSQPGRTPGAAGRGRCRGRPDGLHLRGREARAPRVRARRTPTPPGQCSRRRRTRTTRPRPSSALRSR